MSGQGSLFTRPELVVVLSNHACGHVGVYVQRTEGTVRVEACDLRGLPSPMQGPLRFRVGEVGALSAALLMGKGRIEIDAGRR